MVKVPVVHKQHQESGEATGVLQYVSLARFKWLYVRWSVS
jgi:hypothetical protein